MSEFASCICHNGYGNASFLKIACAPLAITNTYDMRVLALGDAPRRHVTDRTGNDDGCVAISQIEVVYHREDVPLVQTSSIMDYTLT
jgi:hypothetical protein